MRFVVIKGLNDFYHTYISRSTQTAVSPAGSTLTNTTTTVSTTVLSSTTSPPKVTHRSLTDKFFRRQPTQTEQHDRVVASSKHVLPSMLSQEERKVSADLLSDYPLILADAQVLNPAVAPEKKEWVINASVMNHLYKGTQNNRIKHLLSFLVLNYLAKSGTIFFGGVDQEILNKLKSMFQLSMQAIHNPLYNRESPVFDPYLREKIQNELISAVGKQFHITDSKHLHPFFPLWFSVIGGNQETWEQQITSLFLEHCKKQEKPLRRDISSLILFDLTDLLEGDLLVAFEDLDKNGRVQAKFEQFEKTLREMVSRVAVTLKSQVPSLEGSTIKDIEAYMIENLLCICRGEVKEVGTLHLLPIFADPKKETSRLSKKFERAWLELENFLNGTGMRLGSVSGRNKVFNFFSLEEFQAQFGIAMEESLEVSIENTFFEGRTDFIQSPSFQRVSQGFAQHGAIPYVTTMGKATVQLLTGLFAEISDKEWDSLNGHPEYKQLIQTTLYKIEQQLGVAETQQQDFNAFMRAIELVHCELATLLTIFSPFSEKDFSAIYQDRLTIIPESLRPFLQVGLTKSGMNTCAAISLAVNESVLDPVKIIQKKSHFELVHFMGGIKQGIENRIHDQSISKVDLFFTEFHHNISLFSDQGQYDTVDVIGNVEALMKEKHATKHLTVAIDATIDHVNSSKMKDLFKHFEADILEGKLNFIIFRSGQKFDMLGMDNYYGAPFYLVNNGGSQWNAYHRMINNPLLNTDLLSLQWFCLANKYTPEGLDNYKAALFQNTKAILESMPAELVPNGSHPIKVCGVSPTADTCLIDIKCKGPKDEKKRREIEELFFQRLVAKNIRTHHRAGYGYFNVNINSYTYGLDTNYLSTIRINPGINLSENQTIIDFLKEVLEPVQNL